MSEEEGGTPAWFGVVIAVGCLVLVLVAVLMLFGGVWATRTYTPPP